MFPRPAVSSFSLSQSWGYESTQRFDPNAETHIDVQRFLDERATEVLGRPGQGRSLLFCPEENLNFLKNSQIFSIRLQKFTKLFQFFSKNFLDSSPKICDDLILVIYHTVL